LPTGNHYSWTDGPADIDDHSITKHEVLIEYLKRYFEQRTLNVPQRDYFRITLVDGFCGGGQYKRKRNQELVFGSPLLMLNAVAETEMILNQGRQKPLKLDVQYVFVDKDESAISYLRSVLNSHGYGSQIGISIHLICGTFVNSAERISAQIKAHTPKAPTALFFLDQYGYSDVPADVIASIFTEIRNAEIILTFHVDSFATYSNSSLASTISKSLGIDINQALQGRTIEEIKESDPEGWRRMIQAGLYRGLVERCDAAFFTPFFIRGSGSGHGEYWLVHLSQHPVAQDVMKQTHWKFHNHFTHYGGAGLYMLPQDIIGFRGAFEGGFRFDETARDRSYDRLTENLSDFLRKENRQMSIREIFSVTCNHSPATIDMYKTAIARLVGEQSLVVHSDNGTKRRESRLMKSSDLVENARQIRLLPLP
jgi:three-Cys-motif partner protein